MSLRRLLLCRGLWLRLGRSVPCVRVPVRARAPPPPPPTRYRYFRVSVTGLAARLLGVGARGGGRGLLLAFGLGLGFVEQRRRVEEEAAGSEAACEEIRWLFNTREIRYQSSPPLRTGGYRLEDYLIGKHVGKGCSAAVYEAAVPTAAGGPASDQTDLGGGPPEGSAGETEGGSRAQGNSGAGESGSPARDKPSLQQRERASTQPESELKQNTCYPLAVKMLWNLTADSSSDAILRTMAQELVPATPSALTGVFGKSTATGPGTRKRNKMKPHPNIIQVIRAFTAKVPLLPRAWIEYPDVLPPQINPRGIGRNRTLFLVMKNYPCTLRQYLSISVPGSHCATLMILQLLEGVDHLVQQGIAHRDLKSDNILLEFDSAGCPRLVITDFGCCLADERLGMKLPFTNMYVDRGGNSCLMAPEVSAADPGPGRYINYSKSDAWSVGALAYEILGLPNPFYRQRARHLESRDYQETQLPALPDTTPHHVQLVVTLLLRRDPHKRPSARVAANMLHLHLWGGELLSSAPSSLGQMMSWLRCQTLLTFLRIGRNRDYPVETELRRCFLANLSFEEMNTAMELLPAAVP